jgi:hypothetical protein
MKKIFMLAFVGVFALLISGNASVIQTQTNVAIVINEYELNPDGSDSGNEWVELYNRTDSNLNISGWSLEPTHGNTVNVALPNNTIIPAGGYLVVYRPDGKQWLDNSDESIVLINASGEEQDRTHTAHKDSANDGRTWQRCPNGFDTNEESNWEFATSSLGEDDTGASNNCS